MSNNRSHKRLNLNHLNVFVEIAEAKSLTAAARGLGFDKTRVSRILSQLEQSLGAELVYRSTRDLQLTKIGQAFYETCKEALSTLEVAISSFEVKENGELTGHIRVTAAHGVASIALQPIIGAFRKRNPDVTFDVVLAQDSLNLIRDQVDIAVRTGELVDSSLTAKNVGFLKFIFVATPSYLKTFQISIDSAGLSKLPVLTLPKFRNKELAVGFGDRRETCVLKGGITSNSPDFILDLVLKNEGLGLLPEFMCRDLIANGQLIEPLPAWFDNSVPISIVCHKSKRRTPHIEAFRTFLIEGLMKNFGFEANAKVQF